jgi:broad-specificity NMP kinase
VIKQPFELATANKKIRLLIAGYPGIGKSTVALSAPKPLHIDVDRGVDRISAAHRKPFVQPVQYEELLNDLKVESLRDFETLVFDTGGQLIKLIGSWAIRQNSAYGQKDGSLALKGYGAVGREFERLMNYCFYDLNKHVVVVFHSKEEKDGDNTRLRLLVEGQTKDNVWQPMDLGGFMEMSNNRRTIGFSNCERYYAKATHGIYGILPIPDLNAGAPNNFLAALFQKVSENIAAEALQAEEEKAKYEQAMSAVNEVIRAIDSPEAANKAIKEILEIKHVLSSEREAKILLARKATELGFVYHKEGGYKCAS